MAAGCRTAAGARAAVTVPRAMARSTPIASAPTATGATARSTCANAAKAASATTTATWSAKAAGAATCRNPNMKGGTLYAQCQRMNGGWRDSSIDPRQCGKGGVANDNGNLICEGGGGGNTPGGSWQQTCRNANVNGGTLYAQCQRMNGGWRYSSIDPRQCGNGGVANNDGNLVWEGGGGGGGDKLPGGSWQQSC